MDTAKPEPWKSGYFTTVEYHALSKFSCDGVSVRGDSENGFFWNRPKSPQWQSGLAMKQTSFGGDIEVKVLVRLTNPKHNHDKQVMLRLDVLSGDEVVSSATFRNNVEEGDESVPGTTKLLVPSSKLAGSRLRITMTTQDY